MHFKSFSSTTIEVKSWMSNYTTYIYVDVIIYAPKLKADNLC